MELQDIYDLLESHLGNGILNRSNEKMKRVKLPIPKEYGGGWATGDTTEDAIRNMINRLNLKIKKETPLFSDYASKWLEIKKGEERSESTIKNYEFILDTRLKPFFENKKINEITADDVQLYFNSIMELSKSMSTQSKAILSGIFERADRNGLVDRNIMKYKYQISSKTGEKVVLQDDELISVIDKLEDLLSTGDVRDYLYFCFLCFTALRRGEILGLKWADIDFDNDLIYVNRNVTFPNGENNYRIGKPKDGSSGIVHLQSGLKDHILSYKGSPKEYIIYNRKEFKMEPITRSMFSKMWYRCRKVLDLKGATSHSFRASYATMMNAHCDHIDPKALQGALRHKTPDLAIKVYTKENHDKTRAAEKEYDNWLKQNSAL